jgi:FkbM family methyltransferase
MTEGALRMLAPMKAQLWKGLCAAVRFCPERLRLAFLEQPLAVQMDFDNLKITAHSSAEYYIRSRSASKEPDTVEWLREIPKDAVFVDVGANVGAYSLMAARLNPKSHILAIEPSAPTYGSLCRNIWINRLQDSITPVCAALCGANGYGDFSYSSWQPGAALHGSGEEGQHHQLSFKLDDLIQFLRFPQPTHLKVDVDGAEQSVLAGATNTLMSIQSLMIEVDENHDAGGIKDVLENSGLSEISSRRTDATGRYINYRYERRSTD